MEPPPREDAPPHHLDLDQLALHLPQLDLLLSCSREPEALCCVTRRACGCLGELRRAQLPATALLSLGGQFGQSRRRSKRPCALGGVICRRWTRYRIVPTVTPASAASSV